MKTLRQFLNEMQQTEFNKNPDIGWWGNGNHLIMYHGTHQSNLKAIAAEGIKAGPNGWVSMTHDPHTAHGYASMHGGEANFRGAKGKAQHVPHNERATIVAKIPREWADKHMDTKIRGNVDYARQRLTNKSHYDQHKRNGKQDHEYYQTTELRFPHIPREFITGYMKKVT